MSEAPKAATFNSNITDITRLLMAHGDINQTELADRMGVSRSSISKKLEGTRQWGFKDIDRLSQAFDEPPATFFDEPAAVYHRLFGDDPEAAMNALIRSRWSCQPRPFILAAA